MASAAIASKLTIETATRRIVWPRWRLEMLAVFGISISSVRQLTSFAPFVRARSRALAHRQHSETSVPCQIVSVLLMRVHTGSRGRLHRYGPTCLDAKSRLLAEYPPALQRQRMATICHNLPMCRRYRLSRRKQLVEEYFDASGDADWNPRYNIAPTQPNPVIRQHPKEPSRVLSLMRWGLIPSCHGRRTRPALRG
jgi:hypothetical protein